MSKKFSLNDFEIKTLKHQFSDFNLTFADKKVGGLFDISYTEINVFNDKNQLLKIIKTYSYSNRFFWAKLRLSEIVESINESINTSSKDK